MKTYKILNFEYNGFCGKRTGGEAPYTATFKEWTTDPGIARMSCSDGKDRLIPGWAIADFNRDDYPAQDMSEAKKATETMLIHLGAPSSSR